MLVLVENAAEAVASSDGEVGQLVLVSDRRGQWTHRAGVRDALMRPVFVVELFELAQGVEQVLQTMTAAGEPRTTQGPSR